MSPRRFGVWPLLPPRVYLRRRQERLPFPLERDDCRLYARARQGLWNGCRALGLESGDEVLVPAYHHGSEVEALMRAGLRIKFFDVTDGLEPEPSELESLLGPGVRALYLIHYLGFAQDVGRWKTWCEERGLLLLEDAAQAWLASRDGTPVGSLGDLAIFCMYKTIGIPDGAAMISRVRAPEPRSRRRSGLFGALKRHGAWLAQKSAVASLFLSPLSTLATGPRDRGGSQVHEFELGDPEEPPSSTAIWMLPRLLDEDIAERRRENYRFLLGALGTVVSEPFASLPDGASPFAFPITSEDKDRFVEDLEKRGVKAVLLWKHPHPSLPVDEFPRAARLRSTVVALPVHQDLTSGDLWHIAEVVQSAH
jgi:dTDP-4-amino-4,6-dideoxygalactose transaminase